MNKDETFPLGLAAWLPKYQDRPIPGLGTMVRASILIGDNKDVEGYLSGRRSFDECFYAIDLDD